MNDFTIDEHICALPPAGRCQSFRPGHQVHWIMWNLYRSAPRKQAIVHDIQGTAITFEVDGQTRIWHHHDPARVAAVLDDLDGRVAVIEKCTTLVLGGANPTWIYCASHELEPCLLREHRLPATQ